MSFYKRARKAVTTVTVAASAFASSVVAFAQEGGSSAPAYMTDLTAKLTEAQAVMTFFIGVAVVWAGYRMVRRVIK